MIAQIALPWLLGVLFGSMLFFAVTVAPTVFRVLPTDQGGAFLRQFFPKYYLWGLVVACLCTLAAFIATANLVVTGSCLVIAILFVYARQLLMPRINRARDLELGGNETAGQQFKQLHLQSVVINALQLLLILGTSLYPLWT